MRLFRSFKSDRRGAVAVMVAVSLTALLGVAALAIDVGAWEANANAMQGAADQGALAASFGLVDSVAAAQNEAKGVVAAYGFVDGTNGVHVTVNIPPTSGAHISDEHAIQVTVTQLQTNYLEQVVLGSAPTLSASAVAAVPQSSQDIQGTCMMMLATTVPDVTANGSGTVGAQNCNVYLDKAAGCAVVSNGVTVTGYNVNLSSPADPNAACSLNGGVSATNKLNLGAAPATDPYASRILPTPSSCQTANTSSPTITLLPGTYCSAINLIGNNTITLNSGLYIFEGDINVSGTSTFTGSNVSLVFINNSSINTAGTLNLNLTPMKTGPTAGMAIWMTGTGGFVTSGASTLNVNGAIYIPNGAMIWSGNASMPCTQLIASTITFNGTATFQHKCAGFGLSEAPGASGDYRLVE